MSEENEGGAIRATIEAATGLVKAVPIYDDAIQPAAKELGKSLGTVAKLVNVALAPISVLVWGYDQLQDFINNKVSKKLEHVPEEKIITPDPSIVGPALESLRYTGNNETLSDMYANLIANAMDADTVKKAHPGFVEIIKNLTSDEGLIMKVFTPGRYKAIIDVKIKKVDDGEYNMLENFSVIGSEAGCNHLDLVPSYIDNLCRLGLLIIPPGRHLINDSMYDVLINSAEVANIREALRLVDPTLDISFIKKYIEVTSLGAQFQTACVVNKNREVAST